MRLPVATKMILQIVADSWILRVSWNTVDPYTIPRPNHSLLRINGIRKCDRNIKYACGDLGFQILKIAWFVTGPPMAVAAAFTLRTYRKFRIFFVS